MESSGIVIFVTISILYDARRTSLLGQLASPFRASYYLRVVNTTVKRIDEFGGKILGGLIGLIDMLICWSVRISNENLRLFLPQFVILNVLVLLDPKTIFPKSHTFVATTILFSSSAMIPLLSWYVVCVRLWDAFSDMLVWASNVFCFVSLMKITALYDVIDWCLSSFSHK